MGQCSFQPFCSLSSNSSLIIYFYNQVSDTEWCEAELLKDVLSTRDDESEIMFADGSGLDLSHLNCLILNVATNRARLAIFSDFSRVLLY